MMSRDASSWNWLPGRTRWRTDDAQAQKSPPRRRRAKGSALRAAYLVGCFLSAFFSALQQAPSPALASLLSLQQAVASALQQEPLASAFLSLAMANAPIERAARTETRRMRFFMRVRVKC